MSHIKDFHREHRVFGYRRMTRFVNCHLRVNYNNKRIRRSHGYCTKTSFVNIEENLLNRNVIAEAPNQK